MNTRPVLYAAVILLAVSPSLAPWAANASSSPPLARSVARQPHAESKSVSLRCPTPTVTPRASFVALGDSYSAGEGMNCYLTGNGNAQSAGCHRSRKSWAVGWMSESARTFAACTGAIIANIAEEIQEKKGATLQIKAITSDTEAASLTIGGNDALFASLISDCMSLKVDVPGSSDLLIDEITESMGCWFPMKFSEIRMPWIQDRLVEVYEKILAKADSSREWDYAIPTGTNRHFRLAVATYPRIFPGNLKGTPKWDESSQYCQVANLKAGPATLRFGFTEWNVSQFNRLQDQLNQSIRDAVNEIRTTGDKRIRLVDLEKAFPTNTVSCGRKGQPTPFVNGLMFSQGQAARFAACKVFADECLIAQWNTDPEQLVSSASFHITDAGQKPIARQFERVIDSPVPLSVIGRTPPGVTPGAPYSYRLRRVGGQVKARWKIVKGSLPSGLQLTSDGNVSGTSTGAGLPATVTVQVRSGAETDRATLLFDLAEAGDASTISTEDASCGLRPTGMPECWGREDYTGYTPLYTPPAGAFSTISVDGSHACGVRPTKAIECWSWDYYYVPEPPPGQYRSVTTGNTHDCGLRTDATVVCWGVDYFTPPERDRRLMAPQGSFLSISAGFDYTCGLRTTLSIVCWGDNDHGRVSTVPSGSFIGVSAGRNFSCAIRTDKSIVCWGDDTYGQVSASPAGRFSAVSAGYSHACALRETGQAVCWGDDSPTTSSPMRVGPGRYISISSGLNRTCALAMNGTVHCWGDHFNSEELSPPWGKFASRSDLAR